jgi:hypothetical protein
VTKFPTKLVVLVGIAALAAPAILIGVGRASDHADTPEIAANPGEDITDVYAFPSPANSNNVVLVMNVHPLIGPGQGPSTYFDPNVLYQIKFDSTGSGYESKVIQVKFSGTGASQTVSVAGPLVPSIVGTTANLETPYTITGKYNTTFSPTPTMKVLCGPREDPFFFDLEQFFNIFPDRATPLTGKPISDPNTPQASGFRPAGQAVDFLSNGHYNVLSIVIELPRSSLE